ncbi:MAG TPA: hypothetical protein VIK99_05420 [Thermaerobacter sp.]
MGPGYSRPVTRIAGRPAVRCRKAGWLLGWLMVLAAVLLGLPSGLAHASTGGADQGKSPERTSPQRAGSPDEPVSHLVAPDDVQAAEAYLRQRFADRFGGLYLQDAGNGQFTVVVVVTRPLGAGGEEALRQRLGGKPLRFVEGRYTLAELERIQGTLTQAMPRLQEQGVQVVWSGVDVRTNRVRLGVASDLEQAQAAVRHLPGAEAIVVVEAEPVQLLGAEGGPAVTPAPSPAATVADGGAERDAGAGGAPVRPGGWWAALLTALRRWWAALVAVFH